MNKKQKIALWVGVVNLAALMLFPPVNSLSFIDKNAIVFAGFHYVFGLASNEVINSDVLFLEIVVLAVNFAIAWLLLRDDRKSFGTKRPFNYQKAILLAVAANLLVIMLFPPCEYVYAVTNALLPSFQGFYFIFQTGPMLTIVTPFLYLEVAFVLFNGGVLWLLFRREEDQEFSVQHVG
jgi:hypothetical protein